MKLPRTSTQGITNAIHLVQAVLIFIIWALTIAVLTRDGTTDGRTKFLFALTWLSIPALIYLTMVPMWPRARKFANAYAYAAVDILFTLFWFVAPIAVATWNATGIRDGAAKKKKKTGANCTTFAFGPESKCQISKASVGLGVIVFFLFLITSVLSVRGVLYYRANGTLPGSSSNSQGASAIEAQTKDAFSSSEVDDHVPGRTQVGGIPEEDEYSLLQNPDNEGYHPGRPVSWGSHDQESSQYASHPPLYGSHPNHTLEDISYQPRYDAHRTGAEEIYSADLSQHPSEQHPQR